MKNVALFAALALTSSSALAAWGDAIPAYPQVCVRNNTPYNVTITVDNQNVWVMSHRTLFQTVATYNQVLVAMNSTQLFPRPPVWTQTYLTPAAYGCNANNTINLNLYNWTLVFN